MWLLPIEIDKAHDIDDKDGSRDYIAEDGLHPVFDLQALAGVCFSNKLVPAPAVALAAAEDNKDKGAQGQKIGRDQEIPQIQKCGPLSEGLEGKQTVAQSCGGGGDDNDDGADDAGNLFDFDDEL